MTASVFTHQHMVLFLFKVRHLLKISVFPLIWSDGGRGKSILSTLYWKTQISFNFFFFKTQLDSQKLAAMKHNEDLPSSYCLAVAFLWQKHYYTVKPLNLPMLNTYDQNKSILTQFQKNNFLLLLQQQSRSQTLSINEDLSWHRAALHKHHPFFGEYTE